MIFEDIRFVCFLKINSSKLTLLRDIIISALEGNIENAKFHKKIIELTFVK